MEGGENGLLHVAITAHSLSDGKQRQIYSTTVIRSKFKGPKSKILNF